MRVLLDEQLPRRLARQIVGHDVQTVQQLGWSGVTNGELLRRATESGFQVLLTADQTMQFQQDLDRFALGVIVVVALSNKIEDLLPLVPSILQTIPLVRPGQVHRVAG